MTPEQFLTCYKYIVSIENSLTEKDEDICYVVVVRGMMVRGESFSVVCKDTCYIQEMKKQPLIKYNNKISGYSITLGEIIQKYVPSANPKDWIQVYDKSVTREDQIVDGIRNAFEKFENR